jgi:hypothetical protein
MGNRLSSVKLKAGYPFPDLIWATAQHVSLRDAMRNRDAVGREAQASTVTGPQVRKEEPDATRCG